MDLLKDYGSDSDDGAEGGANNESGQNKGQQDDPVAVVATAQVQRANRDYLKAAPAVSLTAGRNVSSQTTSQALIVHSGSAGGAGKRKQASDKLVLVNNPKKAEMYQPAYGPKLEDMGGATKNRQQGAGGVMEVNEAFDETTFHEQRKAFQREGRALAPTSEGNEVLRTTLGYTSHRLAQFAKQEEDRRNKRPRPDPKEKEPLVYGSDDEVEHGIWAPPSREERWVAENSLTDVAKVGVDALAPEQLAEREYIKERNRQKGIEEEEKEEENSFERLVERKMAHLLPPRLGIDDKAMEPTTTFHGKQEFDYKGRSWMAPPSGLGSITADGGADSEHHRCFVPKKCVHRFTGHNKGVHRIRLFPKTGHLILSAGLDGKCKVWSVPEKQVMRTYVGHSAAVRDVQFNHDGTKFVSASFDRYLRLWNTETGEVLQTFTNRKVPYVVKFYPHDDNFFVVGCSDNKLVTYDATTAEITQEYNHHLAPVNAVVFVEDHGTKMVSSSDDKKVLVWEWDIGVPIKYISDPTMHSMPCLVMHPSQSHFVGQSLDNTIAVFQAGGRFALQRKKVFTGHVVSGYACEMAFSPDGQFLTSGDGNGNLFFWDWKKHKILQKYKAHSGGPAICCAWHPLEPSVMFTCGWDGIIKMWQ